MTTKVPLIGFDRYINFEWCRSALDVAATHNSIEVVRSQIAEKLPGIESQRKTLDVLKRLSTKPFGHLQSLPVLFPFTLTRPLAYVVSNNANLMLRSEGPSNQLVALRQK